MKKNSDSVLIPLPFTQMDFQELSDLPDSEQQAILATCLESNSIKLLSNRQLHFFRVTSLVIFVLGFVCIALAYYERLPIFVMPLVVPGVILALVVAYVGSMWRCHSKVTTELRYLIQRELKPPPQ